MSYKSTSEWVKAGTVYVDSGSILIGDPCYHIGDEKNKEQNWKGFVDRVYKDTFYETGIATAWSVGEGIVCSTGYGDGEYNVFIKRSPHNRIAELKIVFIDPDGDDDYSDEEDD